MRRASRQEQIWPYLFMDTEEEWRLIQHHAAQETHYKAPKKTDQHSQTNFASA